MRVAIIGTYRCGSSAVTKLLAQLGANLGEPYFGDVYESESLSQWLRNWWNEPELCETVEQSQRVACLSRWIDDCERNVLHGESQPRAQQADRPVGRVAKVCGAKHPLMSLSAFDIEAAWGPETRFIWVRRDLNDAIESLRRLNWWSAAERIQTHLYESASCFIESRPSSENCLIIDYEDLLTDPLATAKRAADFLEMGSLDHELESAAFHIQQFADSRPQAVAELCPAAKKSSSVNSIRPPQMAPERIAATLISGNSESMVRDAVASVIDFVDEVILIDTGIDDLTEQVVLALAGDRLRVVKRAWDNDFAGMRNAALQAAENSGCQWALTIDTDERIDWGAMTPESLRKAIATNETARTYMVMAQDGSYAKERLVRVPTSLRWCGRTDEALVGAAADQRPLLPGVSFGELAKTAAQMDHKLKRDLGILRQEVCDKPDHARWWYFLGQTLAALGRHEGAVSVLDRCVELKQWNEQSAWACFMAAKSLSELGRWNEAVERCGIGMACDPAYPELAWMAAWCEYRGGRMREAISWAQMSIAIGHAEGTCAGTDRVAFRNLVGWYEGPLDVLRFALRKVGRAIEAERVETRYLAAKRLRTERYQGH